MVFGFCKVMRELKKSTSVVRLSETHDARMYVNICMYLSISESTVSKQQGNFPFLENICGKYFLSRIHLLVSLCSSSIIWIQNFIFCVQDVGFKDFSRKGENSTFIRVSSSHTLGFKRSILVLTQVTKEFSEIRFQIERRFFWSM